MAEENYYDDSPSPEPPAQPTEESDKDSNVALLPKSFFPPDKDLTPGNTCKVKVEEVQEDQVLVTYVRDEETEEAQAPETMPMRDEEMAQYME